MGRVMKGIYSNIQFVQYTNHVYEKSTQNMKVCECGVCVCVWPKNIDRWIINLQWHMCVYGV